MNEKKSKPRLKLNDEIKGEMVHEELKGCTLRLTGGADKNGFGMK